MEFPNSTHGDGLTVEISRFPGGTAVGFLWTTESGASIVFAIPRASLKRVAASAIEAILRAQDGADLTSYDEDDDVDDDSYAAVWYGEKELAQSWARSVRAQSKSGRVGTSTAGALKKGNDSTRAGSAKCTTAKRRQSSRRKR